MSRPTFSRAGLCSSSAVPLLRSGATFVAVLVLAACPLLSPSALAAPRANKAGGLPSKPTPEQEKALANPLHKAHQEAKKDPTKCRDCHSIEGQEKQVAYRCTNCHEDQKQHLHAKTGKGDHFECLTCHHFYTEKANPWECKACHVEESLDPALREKFATDKLILVHGKEDCKKCHVPHGAKSLKVGPCLECHEKQKTRHHAKETKDPVQCFECHKSHEKLETIVDPDERCISCHRTEKKKGKDVPATAIFKGHGECTFCHRPHEAAPIRDCKHCHEMQVVVGAKTAAEHRVCQNCHTPHQMRGAAKDSCVRCHEKVLVAHKSGPKLAGHPADEKQGACVGCHAIHPEPLPKALAKAQPLRPVPVVRPCEECHKESTPAAPFHGDAPCVSCHAPHRFELKGRAEEHAFCISCHATALVPPPPAPAPPKKGAKAVKPVLTRVVPPAADPGAKPPTQVKPVKGHDKCAECHLKGAHTPRKDLAACASCHEPVKTSLTKGHEKCAECHEPHAGTVAKKCVECHDDREKGAHAKEVKDCKDCHRSHGPNGPKEPKACLSCHDKPLVLLHGIEKHRECQSCHDFHGEKPKFLGRDTCTKTCHQTEKVAKHEPGARLCTSCHSFGVRPK